jgi:hypothetical protein
VARLPDPTPPDGMLLIRHPDGSPWLFVDAQPVSHAEFATIFPKHKKPKGADAKPVTDVAFTFARAFATSNAKRLLRADEWEAAQATTGFVGAGSAVWEWIDDAAAAADQRTVTTIANGTVKTARRASKAYKDVTFRMGRDLPSAQIGH